MIEALLIVHAEAGVNVHRTIFYLHLQQETLIYNLYNNFLSNDHPHDHNHANHHHH